MVVRRPVRTGLGFEAMDVHIRRARTSDVRAIRSLVDTYTADRRLLSKATVTLYEAVQEFWWRSTPTTRCSAAVRCT